MKRKSIFINRDMIEGFVCDDVYTSYMMTGDELLNEGEHMINCNMGTLKPHSRLAGGHHDDLEIYYVVDCRRALRLLLARIFLERTRRQFMMLSLATSSLSLAVYTTGSTIGTAIRSSQS